VEQGHQLLRPTLSSHEQEIEWRDANQQEEYAVYGREAFWVPLEKVSGVSLRVRQTTETR